MEDLGDRCGGIGIRKKDWRGIDGMQPPLIEGTPDCLSLFHTFMTSQLFAIDNPFMPAMRVLDRSAETF